MVDVNAQSKTISVNVSSSGVSSNVNASGDASHYYSEKAREWAISNRIVDGVDYSSKYYAGKANESALNAQSFAQYAQDSYNNFQQSVDGALSNIDNSVQTAITTIDTKSSETIESINNTKTTILNDIEFVADGEKKEIEDLIDSGKEELKESIGDVKALTTLEIGDIGIAPLGIDETKGKRRYLNGQVIIQDQYVEFTNKVKSAIALYPTLACTESEWQTTATMTVGGQVGKFVVDNNAGTIRLPKIIMPIQGLTDLSKLGEIVEAGLPNISAFINGVFINNDAQTTGAFTQEKIKDWTTTGGTGTLDVSEIFFNSSLSNSTYGNSNTVQQEQIQYPYFIQVATGAETEDNIINEIELNNPFSLLDYKYSEYELNNLSWLRSNGQYNSKAIYPAVYDLLLKIYNGTETKAGVSVKLSTGSYTDYDFVLNTAEETFRLPKKVKLASGKAVIGNGMSLGITDGIHYAGLAESSESGRTYVDQKYYGCAVNTNNGMSANKILNNDVALGITTDPTKSGIETSDSGLYLYFYVGETVQNANLINAGRIEETLVKKVDMQQATIASFPSSRYIDLTLGASGTDYTAPANGYFTINKTASATNQSLQVINRQNQMAINVYSTSSSSTMRGFVPVLKGQQCRINYSLGGTTTLFRFVYAEGDR